MFLARGDRGIFQNAWPRLGYRGHYHQHHHVQHHHHYHRRLRCGYCYCWMLSVCVLLSARYSPRCFCFTTMTPPQPPGQQRNGKSSTCRSSSVSSLFSSSRSFGSSNCFTLLPIVGHCGERVWTGRIQSRLFLSSSSSSSSSSAQTGVDSSSSSSSTPMEMDADGLTRLQSETSTRNQKEILLATSSSNNNNDSSKKLIMFQSATEHVQHQQAVFDELSPWFAHHGHHVPENLVAVYQHLARQIISSLLAPTPEVIANKGEAAVASKEEEKEDNQQQHPTVYRILDVGTGTGVLYSFLLQAAAAHEQKNITLHITGVDLSLRMIELARENAAKTLQAYSSDDQQQQQQQQQHSIDLVQANVLEYHLLPTTASDENQGHPAGNDEKLFDAVIINACFGNFFDPRAVLQHVSSPFLLKSTSSSSIFVTHPLGSAFVQQLHDSDPLTVPHLLPASIQQWQSDYLWPGQVPLTVQEFYNGNISIPSSSIDDNDSKQPNEAMPFYYCHLRRVRYTLLPSVLRFRGRVANGYGRGGKKLGFPTANLPSRLFQEALQNVTTGVYFGWALLEDTRDGSSSGRSTRGRNVRHKAVVNVGYSPTFEGQENPEKIIEAHLMLQDQSSDNGEFALDPPDFYNETMRLELVAFLRREIKFRSFPALIAQIQADVQDSKVALQEHSPFVEWMTSKKDVPFWNVTSNGNSNPPWMGTRGGDDVASWEFQDMRRYLLENEKSQPSSSSSS